MAYTKQTWSDLPSKTTPINASRLGHIEQGIYDAAATADNASTAISAMGTAVSKNSTNAVTQNSGDLVESGAVYTAIANAKASCYKPSGDKTCAELVAGLLVQSNLGNVYNITDSGTTTSDFVGGAGKPISVGDNVAIVDVGSSVYKFDLLAGMVDLSNYQTKALSAQVEGQSTVEGALGALSDADQATRQLIDDTVGWVTHKWDDISDAKQYGAGATWSVSGNSISINGTETYSGVYYEIELPNDTYKFSCTATITGGTYKQITVYDSDNSTALANTGEFNASAKKELTFTVTHGKVYLRVYASRGSAGSMTLSDVLIINHASVDSCKADNSVIAPVENGTTIQNPSGYAVGSHAIRNGAFITWKNAKAQGETIADSDYKSGDVADYLKVATGSITTSNENITIDTTRTTLYKQGNVAIVRIRITLSAGVSTNVTILNTSLYSLSNQFLTIVDISTGLLVGCAYVTNSGLIKNMPELSEGTYEIYGSYMCK